MPMDGRRWTTQEQLEWLQKRHPAYLEAQLKGRYDQFWPGLYQDWFSAFPAREPTVDDPSDSEPDDQLDREHEPMVTSAGDSIHTSSTHNGVASDNTVKKRRKKKVSYRFNIELTSHHLI